MPPRFIVQDEGTIRETRDETPSRPRKRQRTDSVINTGRYGNADCLVSAGPVDDDPEFYRTEGDCIVRILNTRFKVRSLLSDSSPVFQDIIPKHREVTRRLDAPLLLIADADEFRVLLWALHTRYAAQPRKHEDVDRLLLVTAIARQYRCAALEAWSSAALLHTVSHDAAFTASCPSALFCRILDPPRLRGPAYYFHIQRMLATQTAVTGRSTTQFHTDLKLSNAQVVCVLSGYWSLASLWERLKRAPPKFTCAEGCVGGKGRCVGVWKERWGVAVASERAGALSVASVLALLATVRELLFADQELKKNVHPQCRLAALDALKTTAQGVKDVRWTGGSLFWVALNSVLELLGNVLDTGFGR
ncbi:hypothetical protein B0H17DRAFT_1197822 [Mycena rosella]|uniref:BTB domain-containing protein n=1 Tax=Mycena rosella TaxID=1033263 RepID=A0AAD7DSJ5_MYCRO|nr:hypothetical protein B0H17DRAFT_1197822 [Mycena rosella]